MNHPIETIRDGNLKATVWENDGEKGPFYSVNLSRTYTDEAGNYHDSDSFTGAELLRISRLAAEAYGTVSQLRNEALGQVS